MKKLLPLFFSVFTLGSSVFGQVAHRCGTTHAIEYQESKTPGYKTAVNQTFDAAKLWSRNHATEKAVELYTIPVVVHVVYNNAAQNIADSVILDQIRVLNEDYGRLNADTINMRSDFEPVKGNPRIKFVLAGIDPDGMPTTGITRTMTSTTSFGSLAALFGDFTDLEKVKSTADGGHDPWNQAKYLNIWVCNMAVDFGGTEYPMLLGYATPPAGLPNWPPGSDLGLNDGVVIQYQAFGSNNPNILDAGAGPMEVLGRTSSHEVGHYLGLRHIWGDGGCTEEDGIDDTPNASDQSQNDCDDSKNTCTDLIAGADLPDMIENYMDYSAETCQNSWTQGQVDLMHGVLENERWDLVHDNPASISENKLFTVNVFPIPATDDLTIEHNFNGSVELKLIDMTGKIVLEEEINSNSFKINVNQFKAGVYQLVLVDREGNQSLHRVIKN